MLLQAREVVWDRGLVAGPGELNMEDLIRDAEVPRSSVFRIWPQKSEFVDALMLYLASPDEAGLRVAAFDEATLDCAREVFSTNADRLGTWEGRRSVVREAIRVAALQNFQSISDNPQWSSFIALVVTVRSVQPHETQRALAEHLYEAERGFFLQRMAGFYESIADAFGLRMRDGLTFEHLAEAGAAVVEGLALGEILARKVPDDRSDQGGPQPTLHQIIRDPIPGPGLDGATADWSLPALSFLAVFESMTEYDKNANLSTDALADAMTRWN